MARGRWRQVVMTLTILAAVASVFLFDVGHRTVRNWWCATSDLEICKKNLKDIATAMHKYRKENNWYPATVAGLTPRYLTSIPTCPAAGRENYVISSEYG